MRAMTAVGTNRTNRASPMMSSVDGSRVARVNLTQWHWSGAVFCPACSCSRSKLLALMGSANKVPICFAGYDASDIAWVVPVPGLTGLAITSRRSHNLVMLIVSAKLSIPHAASAGTCAGR